MSGMHIVLGDEILFRKYYKSNTKTLKFNDPNTILDLNGCINFITLLIVINMVIIKY